MILDSETKAVELPEHHGDELRLWLRLLTCTTLIEGEVRSRLRERFDVTLPRFDLMAQLDKVPEGMTLSDVSKRMMVSNGNVTGLVERLVESGHLDRRTSDADRRVQVIRLTKAGRAEFRKMAAEHELWIADMFSRPDAEGCPRIDASAGQDQGVGAEIREAAGFVRPWTRPSTMRSSTTTGRGCRNTRPYRRLGEGRGGLIALSARARARNTYGAARERIRFTNCDRGEGDMAALVERHHRQRYRLQWQELEHSRSGLLPQGRDRFHLCLRDQQRARPVRAGAYSSDAG